jgi:hypothetical protein
MWNDPDPKNPDQKKPEAKDSDMRVGAVDAICSLLEPREYQGGMQTFESAAVILSKNPLHKVTYAEMMLPEMKALSTPDLSVINITGIKIDFPNVGVPENIHTMIIQRFQETMDTLFGPNAMFSGYF